MNMEQVINKFKQNQERSYVRVRSAEMCVLMFPWHFLSQREIFYVGVEHDLLHQLLQHRCSNRSASSKSAIGHDLYQASFPSSSHQKMEIIILYASFFIEDMTPKMTVSQHYADCMCKQVHDMTLYNNMAPHTSD